MNMIRKILFSPITMVVLLVLLSFFMGLATFIENDYGAREAKLLVYNAWWFELLWLLMVVNFAGAIFERKLYKRRKWPVLAIHVGFIVILLGAAVTRYVGYEGLMHIREGHASNVILMDEKAVKVKTPDADQFAGVFSFDNQTEGVFSETLEIAGKSIDITLTQSYPAAIKRAAPVENGEPIIGFVLAGKSARGFAYIAKGETKTFGDFVVAFKKDSTADLQFTLQNDTFYMQTRKVLSQSQMGNQSERKFMKGRQLVELKSLYQTKGVNFVVQETYQSAQMTAKPTKVSGHASAQPALVFSVNYNNQQQSATVWQSHEFEYNPTVVQFSDLALEIDYGFETVKLPFEIYLNDFEIERYPGSNSPSSFSSHVTVKKDGQELPYHIYMNNILKMDGYRFFQSSYDQDEKGTVLSVNRDRWGTGITYAGYFVLILGLILSLMNKYSFVRSTKVSALALTLFITLGLLSGSGSNAVAQEHTHSHVTVIEPVDKEHAESFGKLLIQDKQGRTKPVNTLAFDIVHKISRKGTIEGLTPAQFFLEMHLNPQAMMHIPFIKVGNDGLQKILGIHASHASYADIVKPGQGYALSGMVEKVYAKSPAERDKTDKELIKVDERINICHGIFSDRYMSIFPSLQEGNHQWLTPSEAWKKAPNSADSAFLHDVFPIYMQELKKAKQTGDYEAANEILQGIETYQRNKAQYAIPSPFNVAVEQAYYKLDVFKKLFPFYATVGFIFLILLIAAVIRGRTVHKNVIRVFGSLVFLGFIFHTLALAARWYISGHAPMSNGYESMIFVAWVTILAGFIFNKYSPFALSATAVLGGFTLMVANLSFMDPQITNLVPVLKSYWLTLHVSVITGSYGFLGLGAILGIINMILFSVKKEQNHSRIIETIEKLTVINHKSLSLGLILLTIGTFLGAVWANESWGRYWGWDPKETWSLITIFVYTIVTHARLVSGMRGILVFNVLAVYAFFSVLMTYFGVNYYLSGLHSYAGGDPVPVPSFVYWSIGVLVLLALMAVLRHKNIRIATEK
ncbi:MAG: c-type cytochrome biogenesis protein CcsB [Salinivirgaceae bacterium]